jgi:hypothetical protein
MPTFASGDRVRVRLPDGGTVLADVADSTADPERYLLAIDGDGQLRRAHVSRLTLVRSAAKARAAHPELPRRTDPPLMLYVLAGAAMLALFIIGSMLVQH